MPLLVICEILGLFVNTVTVTDKYFVCSSENFLQPTQMEISKKQKNKLSQLFVPFLKSTLNSKNFF